MTLSDTPGDGLEPKVEQIASILLGSVNAPEQEIYRVSREIVSCLCAPSVGRDTAGPSDHAGLVAALPRYTSSDIKLSMDGTPLRSRLNGQWVRFSDVCEAIAALSRATALKKRPTAFLIRYASGEYDLFGNEELAAAKAEGNGVEYVGLYERNGEALSRAPEAVAWQWKTIDMWYTVDGYDVEDPETYARNRAGKFGKVRAIYTTPPAPQPALALIEELERALEEMIERDRRRYERTPEAEHHFQRNNAAGLTALASAKRFRTGE